MKKFLRNLFSGYFLVILLLLLELVFIIVCQFFLDDIVTAIADNTVKDETLKLIITGTYLLLRLIGFIVAVIIFFKIIAKQEDPEFKIPWIIGMLLLPFFCSILFLIFGNHGLNKRDKKLIAANKKAYDDYCLISTKRQERYKNELGPAVGTFNYIRHQPWINR